MIGILGKYVAAPAAGVGLLASLGVFDLGDAPAGGGGSGGLTSVGAAGDGILQALEGPLAIARNIAAAGGAQMGMEPSDLPEFLQGGSVGSGAAMGPGAGGAAPAAQRKSALAPGGERSAGGAAPLLPSGGGWKSSRPPAPTE